MKKNGRFFLLENNHSAKEYHNHAYFKQMQKDQENDLRNELKNVKFEKEFVDGSAPFGVQNTYNYLWNKSDMKQRIRLQDKLRVQTEQSRYKSPKHE